MVDMGPFLGSDWLFRVYPSPLLSSLPLFLFFYADRVFHWLWCDEHKQVPYFLIFPFFSVSLGLWSWFVLWNTYYLDSEAKNSTQRQDMVRLFSWWWWWFPVRVGAKVGICDVCLLALRRALVSAYFPNLFSSLNSVNHECPFRKLFCFFSFCFG